MDTPAETRAIATPRAAAKQHRMVCKAVANAIGTTCPEISLFLSWPQLVSYRTVMRMRLLKDHPLYGPALSDLTEAECVPVDQLGRRVLAMIDPHREWSPRVRLAIAAGVCVRNRHASAASIAAMIRATISSDGDLISLGVPDAECDAVRMALKQVRPARSADLATDEPARQLV
jgi:hypothetical protein